MRRVARWLFLALRLAAAIGALRQLVRAGRTVAPIDAASNAPAPSGGVTVVIPARNEALRIRPCLERLRADPGIHEVIVVDDHSEDGTADVARALGARVISASALPKGWAGKCWALQQGIEVASTEWVVTLDADTQPTPGLVAALVARATKDGFGFLTVAGRFRCPTWLLQVLHPSLLTTLVYRYGPPGAASPGVPKRMMANGQCMTLRRVEFLAAGGFHPVAASLVEDVALARSLASRGWSVGFLDAGPALTVAMHADAKDAWRGWGRSLPLGGVASKREQAEGLGVVWLVQALPLVRLLSGRGDLLDGVMSLARLGTLAGTRRAYEQPSPAYWLSPLADIPVALRLTQSTLRPERTWRGRTYPT
jgi:dolichol-phosphate mannosyltransferase